MQGYKINLFLPDLIDPTQTPTFKVVRDPGNEETCLLVFHCGAPYEDIAFRIINDDWECVALGGTSGSHAARALRSRAAIVRLVRCGRADDRTAPATNTASAAHSTRDRAF